MKYRAMLGIFAALIMCMFAGKPASAQWYGPYQNTVMVNPYAPVPYYNNYGYRGGYNPFWRGGWGGYYHHPHWGYWGPHHGHRYW